MILPSKHLSQTRALVGIGAEILAQLDEPLAVSELWERVRAERSASAEETPLSFDWFVLALTFLHTIFAVEVNEGLITVSRKSPA
jgi:hypothetical protein